MGNQFHLGMGHCLRVESSVGLTTSQTVESAEPGRAQVGTVHGQPFTDLGRVSHLL